MRADRGDDQRDNGEAEASRQSPPTEYAAAAGDHRQPSDGQQRQDRQRPDQRARVAGQEAEEREVGGVVRRRFGQRAEIVGPQCPYQCQGVVPVHLQAALIHIGRTVLRAVVGGRPVDVGRVQSGEPASFPKRREVGVIGQDPVHLDGKAGGHRVRHGVAVHPDQAGVAERCFEHDHRAAGAACLEVEHHAAAGRERVLADEGLRAAQAGLLGVGEHEHHIVARLGALAEDAGGFQQGGHPGSVVVRAVGDLNRVIMGDQEQPPGRIGARQDRDQVAYPGGREHAAELVRPADGFLHFGTQPVAGQGGVDVVTHVVAGTAAGDMHLGADPLDMSEGTGGAEHVGRGVGTLRRRRRDGPKAYNGKSGQRYQRGDTDDQPLGGVGFHADIMRSHSSYG